MVITLLVNLIFWILLSEGLYRLWISRGSTPSVRLERQRSKERNWDRRWRWALVALVVVASLTR